MLLSEGAIRQSIFDFKAQTGSGKTGYGESLFIHKHLGTSLGPTTMGIMFNKNMSQLIQYDTELAAKVTNKEEEYTFLKYQETIKEYNNWFDNQYPGKLNYIMKNWYNCDVLGTASSFLYVLPLNSMHDGNDENLALSLLKLLLGIVEH